MRVRAVVTCVVSVLAACGDGGSGSAPAASGPAPAATNGSARVPSAAPTKDAPSQTDVVAKSDRAAIAAAALLPRFVASSIYSSRGLVVEAVYGATALSGAGQMGQVTTTGTIEVVQGQPIYSPQPTDRLVAKLGGVTHEFVLRETQGNHMAPTAPEWLQSPHVLRYSHKLAGVAEAEVAVRFDGSRFDVTVKGSATLAGKPYAVDMRAAGATAGQRDFDGGSDLTTEYDMTGTIKAPDLEVAVNEHHVLKSAACYSLGLLYSQRGSASRLTATMRSTFKAGGHDFAFVDVTAQTDQKEKGGNQSAGVAAVSGTVTKDGAPFGVFALAGDRIVLQTAGGAFDLDPTAR